MYRWIDHPAELELAIEAADEAGVFRDALAALAELLGEGVGEEEHHELSLAAQDRAVLLADWIDELVYLSETKRLVPQRVEQIALGEGSLEATISGRYGDPQHLVKAVTYHRLSFEKTDGEWTATVILDV